RSRAAPGANPYGLLVHAIRAGKTAGTGALLLAATSADAGVNDVGLELARALGSDFKRLLVVLAPSGDEGGASERREVRDGTSSNIVVLSGRHADPGPDEAFDQIIWCTRPSLQDGGYAWLQAAPSKAIVVATRRRSRFGQVRRTAELLRHLGMELVGTVLLPARMEPGPTAQLPEAETARAGARPVGVGGGATAPEAPSPSPAENVDAPEEAPGVPPGAGLSVPHPGDAFIQRAGR